MESASMLLRGAGNYSLKHTNTLFENLGKNHLWQRQLKNVAATTIAGSETRIGKAAYLAAIATVFGHPGRRFGQVVEALILVLAGTALGVAWSVLGLYLGSLANKENPPVTYAIRGLFLLIALIFHGFLRSRTPRLFVFVLLFIIICLTSLTTTAHHVTSLTATQSFYPILLAAGVILLVNLFVLPEFSASFLGETTIETLQDTAGVLQDAGRYFVTTSNSKAVRGNEAKIHEAYSSTQILSQKAIAKDDSLEVQKSSSAADGKGTENTDTFSNLTNAKAKIRAKLASCKTAQSECNFEIAFGVLPPRKLKPISTSSMKKLAANIIAIIGACESKFALVGETDDPEYLGSVLPSKRLGSHQMHEHSAANTPQIGLIPTIAEPKLSPDRGSKSFEASFESEYEKTQINLIKPKREIEFGDVRLLRYLLQRIARPYTNLSKVINHAIDCVTVCIACTYNVGRLPSGVRAPKNLAIEEVDVLANKLEEALITFDAECTAALEGAIEKQEEQGEQPDIMPREEIFLIASFLLNLRQAATHIKDMIKHSRTLVHEYQQRHGRRRLYAPRIKWRKWLYSGGEEEESLPSKGRKENRKGEEDERADDEANDDLLNSEEDLLKATKRVDLESGSGQHQASEKVAIMTKDPPSDYAKTGRTNGSLQPLSLKFRGQLADGLEWLQSSDDVLYAFKLTFAVFLVVWPALVARWNTWYSFDRGIWAALQLVFITEVSIGTSVMTFVLRGIGTTLGCLWGWAALEARGANRIVVAAMICVGLIPCTYVQLGTKYPKAGMVAIVSMCVVALSTEIQTVPGSATENFLKRWIAFIIGGVVALIVEVGILPVKARTRLVEAITAAIRQIIEMETCVAAGIEEGVNLDVYDPNVLKRFNRASGKANGALTAAETFLPFCSNEPRIKGSFHGLAVIYSEILFVLHQITDRMDNMLQLRTAYGSGPLEEFNAKIYPYRRNVAGSINLTLFAIQGALTSKLSLPQFFPSARLAHLRMTNRVREIVQQSIDEDTEQQDTSQLEQARHRAVRRKYMAWNAASAAQAEVIEYLEELIDLTKLLVGANEFRSGLLMRTTYHDYAKSGDGTKAIDDSAVNVDDETRDEVKAELTQTAGVLRNRRRATSMRSAGSSEKEEIPASLKRIQSRKIEAGIRRQATSESWNR